MNWKNKKVKISKFMSYILRHNPEKFGLKLDEQGFVEVDKFVSSVREKIPSLTKETIIEIIDSSPKRRFEIIGDKIRATYGHSIAVNLNLPEVEPPEVLYHGTPRNSLPGILKEGLKPMGRQLSI